MTIFDLVFIVVFLASLLTFAVIVVHAVRGRLRRAGVLLRRVIIGDGNSLFHKPTIVAVQR